MSYYSNNKKKNIIIMSIISVILLLGILLFLLLSKDKPNEYKVNFYDNTDILGSYILDEDERITQSIIDEVLSKIETDLEKYSYLWSFNNDELIEVDFSKLNYDSNIYLHRIFKEEYEITVEKNDYFGYEIITTGPLTENASASLIINSNVDEDQYKIFVYANDKEIFKDEDGYYQITDINEDINITVKYLEILNIVSNMNDSYIYNGENINITYQVFDLNNELVNINSNDIEIKLYDELNNQIDNINKPGKYKVIYEYIGDEYYIENTEKEIIINKETLTIKPLNNDSYIYNGENIDINYQVLNSNNEVINIDNNDIEITYYDSNNNIIDNIINVGEYKVKYQYIGSVYDIKDVESIIRINKATPIISVLDKEFTYDGTVKKLEISDVDTNSNGEIKFINNENKDVGKYEIIIEISETDNYLSASTTAYIIINKAIPTVINLPSTSLGYEGNYLDSIDITDGEFNVDGSFKWNDETEKLFVGSHEYKLKFIPNDINNYEICEMNISVSTLSYEETLNRIKVDREDIYESLEGIITNNLTIENINEIKNLPIIAEKYNSTITWYSNSNIINIDNLGNIKYLDIPGKYQITLIGYVQLGNTVEYLRYLFTLEISKEIEHIDLNIDDNQEKETDFEKLIIEDYQYDESNKVKVVSIINLNNNYDNYINNIPNESIEEKEYITKEELNVSYETNDCYQETISEVILWRILTDGASDDNNNINLENKAKDIQKISKGEHNI